MPSTKLRALIFVFLTASAGLALYARSEGDAESRSAAASALAVEERLAACDKDPRVIAGLVTREVCAGGDLFVRKAPWGNGRTCGSCHPAENTFTTGLPVLDELFEANPFDVLFVFEPEPDPADPAAADPAADELSDLELVRERIRDAEGAWLLPHVRAFMTLIKQRLERQAQ